VVVELVLGWIPRRSVVLGDIAKLNVSVGGPKRPGRPFDRWQSIGTYHATGFDIDAYLESGAAVQQRSILALLRNAFACAARATRSNGSVCLAAVDTVARFGLPLPPLDSAQFWQALPPARRRSQWLRKHVASLARRQSLNALAQDPVAGANPAKTRVMRHRRKAPSS
jgi:hypothetical protein